MKSIARIGDTAQGNCLNGHEDIPEDEPKPFITTFITGSNNVYVNFRPVVGMGDVGSTDCGHLTTAITGSGSVYINYKFVHRVGDVGVVEGKGDTYTVLIGSDNVQVGG
jgi:uncharacterized Zn-binding protein involved in type VI secretion